MLRDNLAGLIEPMIDRAGTDPFGGHPKQGPTGGCSRSTKLTIVVLKRSWHQDFRRKTGRQTEKAKRPGFEVITVAHDSRAVGTALHQSHRTIDPQCLKKSPPRRGGIYALTENVSSPFHAEPTQGNITSSVTWSSSDVTIVTVSAAGVATGAAEGSATIQASVGTGF
jgi:Big-like domain-containing protein